MTASEIRQTFLDYFASKGHTIVPSAPIVVKNDPTLMFTNAGMNQFKDWFLGNEPPKYTRVVDTQKCLRVSGKHNDLEEVGVDTYHHTMFEMLGNWSFGDYFKKEAIEWAWELLTEVYRLPKDRLYVTVFEGDAKEGLAFDQEAYDNWALWIDKSRILNGNKKDNFWEMGDTGPCGPCSEIHVDLRSDAERKAVDGSTLVNHDHPQVIEIWNNVFMEFNRIKDQDKIKLKSEELNVRYEKGQLTQEQLKEKISEVERDSENTKLVLLPDKHVDTGMGFERLVRAIEGKSSNYDTDVFVPTIQFIEQHSGIKYQYSDSKTDIAMRVLADHIRAISLCIADGQLPASGGAGYVIRRILRRAVRYQFQFLNLKEPFLNKLVNVIADSFKNVFPELYSQKDFVAKVIREEEQSFLRTLDKGISKIISKVLFRFPNENVTPVEQRILSGEFCFELFDTFGFPIDLTKLIAHEHGWQINEQEFEEELAKQKARSRKAAEVDTEDWVVIGEEKPTQFLGYDTTESEVSIIKFRKVKAKGKEQFQLVFNQTPFYPEGGGQVGDTGYISNANEKVYITDTKKENNLIIHFAAKLPENIESVFTAVVDTDKRYLTENNHSATHLLHAALRKVLGTHVQQKGSLVNNEYLRFDFSHFSAMTAEEITEVEKIVNRKIRENIALDERRNVPIAEAQTMGAMMLFGEKYGESVRVITFDEKYSRELCGGTHVKATGQIGLFKITSESAVAAGVRRIEAITADAAEELVNSQQNTVNSIKELLKAKDPVKSVEQLLLDKADLLKRLEVLEGEKTQVVKAQVKQLIQAQNGLNVLVAQVDVPNAEQLKNLSFQLKQETENLFCVLGTVIDGKPLLSVMMSDNLVKEKNLHAGNIIKELAKEIQGGGGGQPFYATAGGTKVEGLASALQKAKTLI
ncbi:MAG: alanine--tRNA ligase [Bacteroidia bacterium]